jgi:hypothetical protein
LDVFYINQYAIEEDTSNDVSFPHMKLYSYSSENSIIENSWTKVSNLLDVTEEGRYYELKVDDSNLPYIQLCQNYEQYVSGTTSYLALEYIVSNGASGNVSNNVGFILNSSQSFTIDSTSYTLSKYISFGNEQSSYGHDPETYQNQRTRRLRGKNAWRCNNTRRLSVFV